MKEIKKVTHMFEKPHMAIEEQLKLLLNGKMELHDTDFKNCDVYTIGIFEDELHIDTPDGRCFLLTISQIENAEE